MDQVSNAKLIEDFREYLVLQKQSASTVKNYLFFVKAFADFIAPDSLLAVNRDHLRRYLAHLGKRSRLIGRQHKLNDASVRKYFVGLSSFFEFLLFDERYKEHIEYNPVIPFRKHYFKRELSHDSSERRQCISLDEAKALLARVLDQKEKTVLLLLFDTGVRLHELSELDIGNVDFADESIEVKKTTKRSHNLVFFRKEVTPVLKRYLAGRKSKNPADPLFTDRYGKRLSTLAISRIIQKHATACGFHDPDTDRSQLEDRFTTHCTRHAFSTWLGRRGMAEKYIQELRGDKWHNKRTFGVYTHIEHDELKEQYLAFMPNLLT